jgi:CDP-diacylglycerol---serine O-phosphatidyltransferase
MSSPILRQLELANAFTLTGLLATLGSAVLAIRGQLHGAVVLMMAAGLVDLFDGLLAKKRAARRTELQSKVGAQLDSLVDVCSFGFGPAVFGYCAGLRHPALVLLLGLFAAAAALRLGYFNVAGMSEGGRYFTGVPVTYAALVVPLVFTASLWLPSLAARSALAATYAALAAAMVSSLKVPKPRGLWYAIFPAMAVVMAGVHLVLATVRC